MHFTQVRANARLIACSWLLLLCCSLLLAGCGSDAAKAPSSMPRGTLITQVLVEQLVVEETERTVGRIRSRTAPVLVAEVAGAVQRLHVDAGDSVSAGQLLLELDAEPYRLAVAGAEADVRRMEITLRNRERDLARNAQLLRDRHVNQSTYDAVEADVQAQREQFESIQVHLQMAQRDLRRTQVRAPVAGIIDERFVSAGDYVRPGERLFRLVAPELVRVHLPFPETLGERLAVGQIVRLELPDADAYLEAEISELRPALLEGSRTLEALVDVSNPGTWRQGGSVAGTVVLAAREALVVPARAVVQRPAGEVVYVIEGDRVRARLVTVGRRDPAQIEILSGLNLGEPIAADGAGFLSDGALVRIAQE